MQVGEEKWHGVFVEVSDVMSTTELEEYAGGCKALAGFDFEMPNSRPSLISANDRIRGKEQDARYV